MNLAITQWTSPKPPTYNLIDARLDSLKNWPRGLPSPESLSEAGFFFNGMYKKNLVYLVSKSFWFHLLSKILSFQGERMRQFAFAVGFVFTNGYLQTMRGRNTHAGHLFAYSLGTSKATLSFTKVDGWQKMFLYHKIQIGKKMFLYVT